MIDKTFDNSKLTPTALEKICKGELFIKKISDNLYVLEKTHKTRKFFRVYNTKNTCI